MKREPHIESLTLKQLEELDLALTLGDDAQLGVADTLALANTIGDPTRPVVRGGGRCWRHSGQ